MIERLQEVIKREGLNIYDLSVMTEAGNQSICLQPCNRCNDSYSIAKVFIMSGIGVLFDQGKLNVEDKIIDILDPYMPQTVETGWEQVTVRHVLKHTIGIEKEFLDIDSCDPNGFDTRNYLERIFKQKIVYTPGTRRVYNDAGFYLLGRVIHAISKEMADRFLMRYIIGRLDFSETAWSICPMGHPVSGTGLYISARDMVKIGWLYMNQGNYGGSRLLSEKWVREVLENGYEIEPLEGHPDLIGKAGMNGQMVCYNKAARTAVAWHSFEPDGRDKLLLNWI